MSDGLNMTAANVDRMNRFLKAATSNGLNEAIQQHHDLLDPEELGVLQKLNSDQLNSLLQISESILMYRDEKSLDSC